MVGFKNLVDIDEIRKRYARVNIYDARNEVGYQAKRTGASMLIRKLADFGAQVIEASADVLSTFITGTLGSILQFIVGKEIASNLGLFAGAVGGSLAGLAGMGIAGGISAGFAQVDHIHQKRNLKNMYAEEIGAKLGKSPAEVIVEDMEAVAKNNPVLNEELQRTKRQRNLAIPLAVVATIASFSVAVYALPAIVAAAGLPALTGIGGFIVKGAVSMIAYAAVKIPLNHAASSYFDMHKETASDRIAEIAMAHYKGVEIEPVNLMPVFVKANPKLSALIIRDEGKPFDELPTEAQLRVTQHESLVLPLEHYAQDINSGSMKAQELLFISAGTASGVARKIPEPVAEAPQLAPHTGHSNFQDKFTKKDADATFVERIKNSAEAAVVIS